MWGNKDPVKMALTKESLVFLPARPTLPLNPLKGTFTTNNSSQHPFREVWRGKEAGGFSSGSVYFQMFACPESFS